MRCSTARIRHVRKPARTRTHGQEVGHGARAQAALLAAAAHLRLQAHARAAADVDGAHALGPVQLVARDGQQVDVHGVDVEGDLAHRLRWAAMMGVSAGSV